MRMERLDSNKFKIFLTFDDLVDRGFTKEELWKNFPKTHQMFQDMLFEASDELGFEIDGNLLVHVHLLQAQGMLIVVTQDLEFIDDEYVEMKVTLDENKEFMFSFSDFESVIQVSNHLIQLGVKHASVYYWNNQYYMKLYDQDLQLLNKEGIIAVMSEFSFPSTVTSIRLKEYGKPIMEYDALYQIQTYFLS
ncbi:genetic competence negative regulator [Salinibacillus xinjiangensis]|uniref:Adapter protein MecA n=1 Tax=Salinibacillus xinjiangensis TaxID=1229268 RepID=A0A6G1X603_9BACI|nr:genetic competence negative regulator [Salinibacillus xinjiangensis]MRG86431.1 genetic competence negative regulator [Salinibacillus xinjiangensis]